MAEQGAPGDRGEAEEPALPQGAGAPAGPSPRGGPRRGLIGLVVGVLVLGGVIGAAVVLLLSDDDGSRVAVEPGPPVVSSSTVPDTAATTVPKAVPEAVPKAVPKVTTPPGATTTTAAAPQVIEPAPLPVSTTAPGPPVIVEFRAQPPAVACPAPGTPAVIALVWAVERSTGAWMTMPGGGSVPAGVYPVGPSVSTEGMVFPCWPGTALAFTLSATNPSGTVSQTVVVVMVSS